MPRSMPIAGAVIADPRSSRQADVDSTVESRFGCLLYTASPSIVLSISTLRRFEIVAIAAANHAEIDENRLRQLASTSPLIPVEFKPTSAKLAIQTKLQQAKVNADESVNACADRKEQPAEASRALTNIIAHALGRQISANIIICGRVNC